MQVQVVFYTESGPVGPFNTSVQDARKFVTRTLEMDENKQTVKAIRVEIPWLHYMTNEAAKAELVKSLDFSDLVAKATVVNPSEGE